MARTDIEVQYDKLEQIINLFEQQEAQTQGIIHTLQKNMEQLRKGWVGEGATAFFTEMEADVMPRMKKLSHALEESSNSIQRIGQVFSDAEEEASRVGDNKTTSGNPTNKNTTPSVNGASPKQAKPVGESQYTVEKGDTLWDIAKKHGIPLNQLIAANPQIKDPNLIFPGQEINIPGGAAPKQPAPSIPTAPPTNIGKGIGGNKYNDMINQFNVASNPKYVPRDGKTYCNVFAANFAEKYGAPLPLWVTDGKGNITKYLGATYMKDWLDGRLNVPGSYTQGPQNGWVRVDAATAAAAANSGNLAIVAGHGHMAVVRAGNPPNVSNTGDVIIAQAGARNFNEGRVRDGWGQYTNEAHFYIYQP